MPSDPTVTVRPARADELEAIGRLVVRVYLEAGYLAPGDAYTEQLADVGRRAEEALVLVAVDGDGPIGSVTYAEAGNPWAECARPGEAEFRMLVVAPEARGRGVGRALVQACFDRARAGGCSGLALSTQPGMTTAHGIYEGFGMVRRPERDWSPHDDLILRVYDVAF